MIAVGCVLCLVQPAFADISPEKERDIKRLLKVSGLVEQLTVMKDGMLGSMSSMVGMGYQEIPDQFWEEYYQLIDSNDMERLLDRVVPVYDRNMSHEVIKKLIEMFENPFWEEWKTKMPSISREAGAAFSQWGQEISGSDSFQKKLDDLIAKHNLKPTQKAP
ncbi:MAG: hypothetical protein COV67_15500 [Nitrospinae bacterium CG11_big_fil_rev_8_21_14_0_20_56_8]|nr:MAG: hypothetical protein COV67_15500 [Nitrospinae bacterium CG11_big_fil_rev_8_21_14_0_20_56_8]